MIESFEDQTHPLTEYELKTLLPLMIQGFTTKIGKAKAVTNVQICKTLDSKGYDVNEPRIRKLVDIWVNSLQSRIDALKETLNYATKVKDNFSDLNY